MAVGERDPHTGRLTTGHEWNGIKELDTPVPRVVYWFLGIALAFSVVYWLLMPAFPTGVSYTKGLLGIDQRRVVADDLRRAAEERAAWTTRIEREDFADLHADPAAMDIVRQTGRRLFGDNCAPCHGLAAEGARSFPSLTGDSWLWGGDPETIAETLRVGINSAHADTRASQMLAFGRDGLLTREDVRHVAAYVRSLFVPADVPADDVAAGKVVFATNCAACHGEEGRGDTALGAPDLTDAAWIYGGDLASITETVHGGRQGHMPTWEARLSPVDRKILTLYVLDLGRSAP